MDELKPCPFCGGKAKIIYPSNTLKPTLIHVSEKACYANGWREYDTEAEAIDAWNTRAERTCRMTDRGECSECGAYIVRAWTEVHDFNGDMKRIDMRSHNYCPNCGARVAPKDSETTPKVVS